MSEQTFKAAMDVGTENGHSHTFDPSMTVDWTSEDNGHSHKYSMDKGVTEFENGHRHTMPNVLKVDIEGQVVDKEAVKKYNRQHSQIFSGRYNIARKQLSL